jgi:hypothetical protein
MMRSDVRVLLLSLASILIILGMMCVILAVGCFILCYRDEAVEDSYPNLIQVVKKKQYRFITHTKDTYNVKI